ncbi:MAG: hypothetical protein HN337_03965 [Deltaproteobacteria bacterium]|jgi:hypothetical protein|nr:hypothetical protein [Deltaproteobacteria bacterium]
MTIKQTTDPTALSTLTMQLGQTGLNTGVSPSLKPIGSTPVLDTFTILHNPPLIVFDPSSPQANFLSRAYADLRMTPPPGSDTWDVREVPHHHIGSSTPMNPTVLYAHMAVCLVVAARRVAEDGVHTKLIHFLPSGHSCRDYADIVTRDAAMHLKFIKLAIEYGIDDVAGLTLENKKFIYIAQMLSVLRGDRWELGIVHPSLTYPELTIGPKDISSVLVSEHGYNENHIFDQERTEIQLFPNGFCSAFHWKALQLPAST